MINTDEDVERQQHLLLLYLHGTLTPRRTNQRAQVDEMDQSDCKKLLPHVALTHPIPHTRRRRTDSEMPCRIFPTLFYVERWQVIKGGRVITRKSRFV